MDIAEEKDSNTLNTHSEWNTEQEKILKGWGDKASCYKLMHDRSHQRYWRLNAWFSIPIIIFSTMTGTGNFAQETFSPEWKNSLVILIGSVNLLSAILLAIKGFLNVAERGESHRLSSIDWDKLGRKIRVELSKKRQDRQNCKYFTNRCQEEYNRLVESQLAISSDIIRWFNQLIDTGKYDHDRGGCQICINDCICFPCGIPMYKFKFLKKLLCTCKNCKSIKKETKRKRNLEELRGVELPEIIGRIKPTLIAKEGEKSNDYKIYNDSNV